MLCVGGILLPSHALVAGQRPNLTLTELGTRQGDAKLPKHVTPLSERILEIGPTEACVRRIRAERHPKATREADGKFRSQSRVC
jgi:hypothetical protein